MRPTLGASDLEYPTIVTIGEDRTPPTGVTGRNLLWGFSKQGYSISTNPSFNGCV